MTRTRSYSELQRLSSFEERLEYLRLEGAVGRPTFGFDRWLNQRFYGSNEWKAVRNQVILRDNGCDLGILDRPVYSGLLIHHMNPMEPNDIVHWKSWIIDPEYLITTRHLTHNAIHYGGNIPSPKVTFQREPGDTTLW